MLGTQLNGLTLSAGNANADAATPFVNVLFDRAKAYNAGDFVGTRTFGLRFTTFGSVNNVFMQNYGAGEAAIRLGASPVNPAGGPAFQIAGYPGPDGESAADHGHFVAVTATTLSAAPLPAPSAVTVLPLAAVALLASRKRGRAVMALK